ncbi:hypothetical protein J155_01183 [Xanthomonas citri pv. citri]|uniref:Uncharacterized protein n=1 Tax=Xanthomonas citri pv. citri TaxID=611301 RepID=A0A0U5BQX2_XANCI|nr:Hypothetical Protein XCAW_03523 [Xanthomonas citri subsp. citri Aw12879]AJD67643.1 hypothetical protein J151_01185 [Xanthomonas citri subsp. citri A306]AJY81177.1 hypothetical protein J159_01182 [Xanthomonas citri pv. citri]AJY85599.1 hypothetical protein J158_01182 [Xanthomonas citri subsp. citri UI6]AJY90022.1 hypothetical protein J169_01181 [Xanthomonas citri pv. citri]
MFVVIYDLAGRPLVSAHETDQSSNSAMRKHYDTDDQEAT